MPANTHTRAPEGWVCMERGNNNKASPRCSAQAIRACVRTDVQQQVHGRIAYTQGLRFRAVPVRGWQAARHCCCSGSRWYKLVNRIYEEHCSSVWCSPTFRLPYVCTRWAKLGRQKELNFCGRVCGYIADSPHTKYVAAWFFTPQPVSSFSQWMTTSETQPGIEVPYFEILKCFVLLVRTIPGQILKAELWVLISSSIPLLDVNESWVSWALLNA